MHSNLINKLAARTEQAVAEKVFTHAAIVSGTLADPSPLISYSYLPHNSTVFDLSSLTKGLITAPFVFKVFYERQYDFNFTIADILAKIGKSWALPSTLLQCSVADLLRHRSGLPAWRNFYVQCLGDSPYPTERELFFKRCQLLHWDSYTNKGHDCYSDIGMLLLGYLLEELSEKPLDDLFKEFCMTWQIKNIGYARQLGKLPFVTSGFCRVRNHETTGEVQDQNCYALGGVTGHSGLFGTAVAVAQTLRTFYLSDWGLAFFQKNAQYLLPNNPGLFGLRQGNDVSAAGFAKGMAMGHLGFTGTAFWIDWTQKAYAIVLTNRVYYSIAPSPIRQYRADVFNLLGSFQYV